ncbi:hypothetical protein O181_005608 [Austropuccinia psidii MF-1]|uniref:Uncharacterized protein n=1 Tax=Austropuccinia psidii MF-1 TaxID=1389203 RepID=A0A9Q3GFQ5_9BASI|nr:hypothetical protein [Austropuccinia psidii MF-1]
MKHIDIQLHFMKQAIQTQLIELRYAPMANMLADFLTKSVPKSTLQRALLAVRVLRLGLRGDVKKKAIKSLGQYHPSPKSVNNTKTTVGSKA